MQLDLMKYVLETEINYYNVEKDMVTIKKTVAAAGTKAAKTVTKRNVTDKASKSVSRKANSEWVINDSTTFLELSKELNKRYPYVGILFYESDACDDHPFGMLGMHNSIGAIMPVGKKRTITVSDDMLVGKLTDEIQVKFGIMAVVFSKHLKFESYDVVSPFITLTTWNQRCEKEGRKQLKFDEKKRKWIY